MIVGMRFLLVTWMGVFMGAVIPGLMCMVMCGFSRIVAVLMLMLVGMGMLVLMGMGMAVGYTLVGVRVFMLMAVLVLMLVVVFVFSFHGCLLSHINSILVKIFYTNHQIIAITDIYNLFVLFQALSYLIRATTYAP